jgi:hypothetical protein
MFISLSRTPPHELTFTCLSRFKHIDQNSLIPLEDQPTFNSNVVEAWLFRIPGLTSQFIGMNDDYFFKAPIHPSKFFTKNQGIQIYLEPWFMGLAADREGSRVSGNLQSYVCIDHGS